MRYTEPMDKTRVAWRYRRFLRWTLMGVLITLPFARRLGTWGDLEIGHIYPPIALVLLVGASILLMLFRCPACGGFFHFSRSTLRPLSKICVHCGQATG